MNLQAELSYLQAHLATLELPTPTPPPAAQPIMVVPPPALSIADLPTVVTGNASSSSSSSVVPATYDLSSLFDPIMVHGGHSSSWNMHQRSAVDLRQTSTSAGSGDLQELARELLHRHGSSSSTVVVPCTTDQPSSLPPHSK